MLPSAFALKIVGRQALVQLVEALNYKPEDRRFHFRWCNCNFSLA